MFYSVNNFSFLKHIFSSFEENRTLHVWFCSTQITVYFAVHAHILSRWFG